MAHDSSAVKREHDAFTSPTSSTSSLSSPPSAARDQPLAVSGSTATSPNAPATTISYDEVEDVDGLKADDDGMSISGFIRKTFDMVSDLSTADIVSWDDKGDSFIVKKEFEFSSLVLPKYFRHKNFSSFVRQLNFYSFHKRSHQAKYTKFQHPYFRRGAYHLLHLIKRKSTEANANFKDTIAHLSAQVTDLKRQYDDIYQIQQQILYIFGRYLKAYPLPSLTPLSSATPIAIGSGLDEREPKRQRLIGDGLINNALPLTTATTLSSTLPSSVLSNVPPLHSSSSERELAELTVLQEMLTSLPGGQAILDSHFGSFGQMTQSMPAIAVSNAAVPRSLPTSSQTVNLSSLPPVHKLNVSALSSVGGPLSLLNPTTLSALSALGSIAQAATQAAQSQQSHALPSASEAPSLTNNLGQLATSLPLSAHELMKLIQHAAPSNRQHRLDGIHAEQRLMEDTNEDEPFDCDESPSPGHYGVNEWQSAALNHTLPSAIEDANNQRFAPAASAIDLYNGFPLTHGHMAANASAHPFHSSIPPIKTQEIGSMSSQSVDPFLSYFQSQLAAGSAAMNGGSASISMANSTMSGATPFVTHSQMAHLSTIHPTLHAALSQLESAGKFSSQALHGQSSHADSLPPNLATSLPVSLDQPSTAQAAQIASQLQMIANVTRQLQSHMPANVHSGLTSPSVSAARNQSARPVANAAGMAATLALPGIMPSVNEHLKACSMVYSNSAYPHSQPPSSYAALPQFDHSSQISTSSLSNLNAMDPLAAINLLAQSTRGHPPPHL